MRYLLLRIFSDLSYSKLLLSLCYKKYIVNMYMYMLYIGKYSHYVLLV